MSTEIESQLKAIFLETLDLEGDAVQSSTVENTVNWDSFGGLNLVLRVEEVFNISLSMNELNQCRSFDSVLRIVKKKLNDKNS